MRERELSSQRPAGRWIRRLMGLPSVLAACLAIAGPASAGELLIELQRLPDGGLQVSYTPPKGQHELPFLNGTPEAHKRWRADRMKPQGKCTSLSEKGLALGTSAGCSTAVVRVEPGALGGGGLHEPAQAVGKGLLSYSGELAVLLKGHALRWRWLPPAGGVVLHQERVSAAAVEQAAAAAQVDLALEQPSPERLAAVGAAQYVYMGPAGSVETVGASQLLLDPAIDAGQAARIRKTLGDTQQALTQVYGAAAPKPLALAVVSHALTQVQADVGTGPVVRLLLPNNPAVLPGKLLEHGLAREVVRVGFWRASASNAQPAWLAEGHAEWLARLLFHRQGLVSETELRGQMEQTLNACLSARGEKPAASLPIDGQGDDPRTCGAMTMLLGQALQAPQAAAGQGLQRLAQLHAGSARVDLAAFVKWADTARTGEPRMASLLDDPKLGFATGLVDRMQSLGAAAVVTLRESAQLAPATRARLSGKLVEALMNSDCSQAMGFWTMPNSFKIDPRSKCTALRPGEDIVSIAGLPVPADPLGAEAALTTVCAAGKTVDVGYASGTPSRLACPKVLPTLPPIQLLRLAPDLIARLKL